MDKFYRTDRRGFTLSEVLIVVAIISILLTVAIPGVISYARRLELAKLDDSARSIFMAAQNRLSAMRNAGEELAALEDGKVIFDSGSPFAVGNIRYARKGGGGGIDRIVPGGSIEPELFSNRYVVEFDPDNGAVFAVWYWEEENYEFKGDEYTRGLDDREKRLEEGAVVGYYGGTLLENRPEFGQMPLPQVTLTNAEELRLEITVPTGGGLTDGDILVEVKVNGKTLITGANIWWNETGTVVLDTLKEYAHGKDTDVSSLPKEWVIGEQFKHWETGVTPGGDIEVAVTLSYKDGSLIPHTVYAHTNSLFAGRQDNTVYIACGRHLQNLKYVTETDPTVKISAEQTGDIDFKDNVNVRGVSSWLDTYTNAASETRKFEPIDNLLIASYDGKGHCVSNLDAFSATGDAGLFANAAGEIKDLRLINARAKSEGAGASAGALVGEVKASRTLTVTDCRVYLTAPAAADTMVSGDTAGGLVGKAAGTLYINNSFASTVVEGSVVGGLVGDAGSAVTVDRSYAAGYLKGGTSGTVGGIAGKADGITLMNSYAAGEIASGSVIGGILADGSATVSDGTAAGDTATYAAVYYAAASIDPSATVYGTFPGDTGVKYAYEAGVNFDASSGDNSLEALEAPAEGTAVPYNLAAELALTTAYPYGRVVKDVDGGLLPHHGDWLNAQPGGIELAYYEKYSNDTWGFYSVKISNEGKAEIARDSLHDGTPGDGVTVVRDGYVVLSPTEITGAGFGENTEIKVNGYQVYDIDTSSVGHGKYTELKIDDREGKTYTFVYNPHFACEAFDLTEAPAGFDYSNWLPKPGSGSTGRATTEVLIRSARQLNNLSDYTNDTAVGAAGWKFTQTIDIDYSRYEFDTAASNTGKASDSTLTPATLRTNGRYNGRGYLIKNLWMGEDSEHRSGLFGSVNNGAVIQNVTLVNVNAKGSGDTGALAGLVSGGSTGSIISGCGAYVSGADQYGAYTVTSTGGHAGGLIGQMQNADVRSSYASVRVSGKLAAGGFVGAMTGSSGNEINNCYAGGRTEAGIYSPDSVNVYADGDAPAGGFVGKYDKGGFSGTVYSTCSVGNGDTTGDETRGLFAGRGDVSTTTDADVFYATGTAYAYSGSTGKWEPAEHRSDERNIQTGAALPRGTLTTDDTFNYDSKWDPESFPFASSLGSHHGDWVEPPMAGIYYWEKENGEYNFYVFIWDGSKSAVEGEICRKHACGHNVDAWGYGVFGVSGTDGDLTPDAAKAKEKFVSERAMVQEDSIYTLATGYLTTVDLGAAFGNKQLVCDTRYGAAVEEKENESALRREIRTLDQLENVSQENALAFSQTHDINAGGGELNNKLTLSGASAGYDGGFYRILNLDIGDGIGGAALFDSIENGAAVKNVILYAPGGDGTVNGTDAAGIAVKVDGGNVDSCVVAGYTISGTGNMGGIAASASGTSAIRNSEATVTLKSTGSTANIGGLVGYADGTGALTVTESYAGGYIDTRDGDGNVQNVGSIGGIVGAGDNVKYTSVYSYVDMTDAMTKEYSSGKHHVYGIGPGTVEPGSRISEYWYAGLPAAPGSGSDKKPVDTADTDPNILGVTLAQLKNDGQKMGASAEELYIPVSGDPDKGLSNYILSFDTDETKYEKFPFAAYVTNRLEATDIRNIHYGAVPSSAYAGIFYYEAEEITRLVGDSQRTETVYSFYAYGGEIYKSALRGERLLDGLCYDHHLNGERARIVDSGYGYFYPLGDEGVTYSIKVDGDPVSSTETGDDDPRRTNLLSALAVGGKYDVRLLPDKSFKTQKWKLEATKDGLTIGDVTMVVNTAFGAVISDNSQVGRKEDGTEGFIQIRTAAHLMNSTDSASDVADFEYYKITHDIDLKGVTYTPRNVLSMMFDGGGYRIIDLSVTSNGNAALFTGCKTGGTVKNVILYSPDGSGRITSTGGNAAGIVSTQDRSLTIENCVVSGYTITGANYVGGIIGSANDSNITISKCQATNTLSCTGTGRNCGAGGIAGYGRGKLTDCVTGGSINGSGDKFCASKDGNYSETTCYTTIGLVPGSAEAENLKATATDTKAAYTYIPNRVDAFDGLSWRKAADEQYPYKTYVTLELDPNNDAGVTAKGSYPAHYGDWPRNSNVAGVMYYEVDEAGDFTYHLLGMYGSGDMVEMHGGLCGERHVDENGVIGEHRIVKSGYALINMTDATFTDASNAVKDGLPDLEAGTGDETDAIKDQIVKVLYPNSGSGNKDVIKAVYPTPEEGDCESRSVKVNAGDSQVEIFYTKGFADVSLRAFGSADQSSGHVHPFYIRTVRQLDNIPDGVEPMYSFVIGHDLYGKNKDGTYYTGYTGAVDFKGSLDGQSYKVLDLRISGTAANPDVGVIASTGSGADLSNIIVYSTDETSLSNDPDPTLSGVNVGALVGRAGGATTITNCASASHVISGTGSLGGLVGTCEGASLVMENCEAACLITVYDDRTGGINAGGLVGDQGTDVSIVNCYAGGKIITPPEGMIGRREYNVGGLVGGESSGAVSTSGSYSYANLLEAFGGNVYAIGNGVETSGSVQYLVPYINSAVKTDKQGEGTGVFMLAEAAAGSRAKWSYKANVTPIAEGSNGYHFRAVVTVDGKLEHYGPWPGMAGLMYWEISVINGKNTFKYHFIGMDEFGNPNNYSTLCTSHHTTADGQIEEHVIRTSGYALINTCGATATRSRTFLTDILKYSSESFGSIKDVDPVAAEALGTLMDTMGFTPTDFGLTAECNDTGQNTAGFNVEFTIGTGRDANKTTVYCTYGLAEVSESKFGTADNPYIVRTRQQLANIDTNEHLTGTYVYNQTHDIYGHSTDVYDNSKTEAENRKANAFKPIGGNSGKPFTGTYDGQGYRILEMDIVSANNRAGLFWQSDGATLKNIILYSPSGTAYILAEFSESSSETDSLNVGGITSDSGKYAHINNCIVAGYVIRCQGDTISSGSHNHYIGGIAAWYMGEITNCQVAVTIEDSAGNGANGNAYIGGLVGGTKDLDVDGCYVGGLVNKTSEAGDNMNEYVGGLVGAQENDYRATIKNSYSYMDMSDIISKGDLKCFLYSLSPVADDTSRWTDRTPEFENNYYWEGGIYGTRVQREETYEYGSGTNKVTKTIAKAVTLKELQEISSTKMNFQKAEATVVPDNVKHLDGQVFPFGTTTVEISGKSTPVHYGMWPEESPSVGALYFELETPYGASAETYSMRYQGFGYSIADTGGTNGEQVSFDNLCTSFGGGDTNNSGFVYFWLDGRADELTDLQGLVKTEETDPLYSKVRESLRNVFGKFYNVAVFMTADQKINGNVSWTLTDKTNPGKSTTVTFDPRFAKIYEAGSAADGTAKPYIVRNITQFQNIDGMDNMHFEQTHDFECTGFTAYKPMTVSGITYEGHVHSIRNLSIDAGAENAALFASVTDSAFDGLALDAPLADNPDSALRINTTGSLAAGIAAETKGECTFTRCAVAGYDITSHSIVGGLVGLNSGDLTLKNCQTVYNPTGTGEGYLDTIGGLVGENSGTLTVNYAYAGGKIFKMTAGSYHVGGLVGHNDTGSINVDHSFCYMDMSELEYDGEGKFVYAIAPSGVDWDTCGYIARGLPAWATFTKEDGKWVESSTLGYGHGKTLFDSQITGYKEGDTASTTYDVSESLGTWLKARVKEDGWELGYPNDRTPDDFPFMAVIKNDVGSYVHFGHTRYASFGTRPYIGFFQVYGTSGGEARLNPNQGPYYAFGWVRDVKGIIGTTIPNDTPAVTDDAPALSDDVDMVNLGRITRTGSDGAKAFMTNRATSYGLLLPKGYSIKDTGITVQRPHEDKAYDKYEEGGVTKYIPWVEHNYQVIDTNGNIIIGDFYVEARDGKPFEIVLDDSKLEKPSDELIPDPGSVLERHNLLAAQDPRVTVENSEAFAAYDMYWFTTDSISGLYESGDDLVSRSRTEFRLEFTFNSAEETVYILPDPSMGDYPLSYELVVESNHRTVSP